MTEIPTRLALRNSTVVNTGFGPFVAPRKDLVTQHLIDFGSHTGPFVELALAVVEPGDLVVDIGGHIGTYTIPLARRVGPAGRVVVFEPNPATRELLEINVMLNDLDDVVTVVGMAVGESERTAGLSFGRSNTGAARLREFVDTEGEDARIAVVPLDHVVPGDPTFIKIDAEGYELNVLAGARDVVDRARPSLLIEVDGRQLERFGHRPADLDDFLRSRDYRLFTHVGERNSKSSQVELAEVDDLTGQDVLIDVLAVRPDVAERLVASMAQQPEVPS